MEVRMPSMMVAGPKQYAKAKMPNEAAVPFMVPPKVASNIEVNIPTPQKATDSGSALIFPLGEVEKMQN